MSLGSRPAPHNTLTAGERLVALGSLVALVGSFMPWWTFSSGCGTADCVSFTNFTYSFSGAQGGQEPLIFGSLAAALGLLAWRYFSAPASSLARPDSVWRPLSFFVAVAGFAMASEVIPTLGQVATQSSGAYSLSFTPAGGLFVAVIGLALAILGTVISSRAARNRPLGAPARTATPWGSTYAAPAPVRPVVRAYQPPTLPPAAPPPAWPMAPGGMPPMTPGVVSAMTPGALPPPTPLPAAELPDWWIPYTASLAETEPPADSPDPAPPQ